MAEPRPAAGEAQVIEAYTLWVNGAPVAQIATVLGTTPHRLQRDLKSGRSSLPHRLQTDDLVARFGWHPATVTRHRRAGLLPTPDGQDGPKYWWWKSTIEDWATGIELRACPTCHSAYPTQTGLRGHITREH